MAMSRALKAAVILTVCASAASAGILQDPSGLSSKKVYDYIIVGGGTAGSVLANRLTENSGVNVLVIEAGSSNFNDINIEVPQFAGNLPNTQFDWNFTTVDQVGLNGRSIPYERGHVLGGSTCVNFMAYTRGSQDDWDRWAKVTGDQGWSWESMQPYMRKLEHFTLPLDGRNISDEVELSIHGEDGPLHVGVANMHVSTDGRLLNASAELSAEFPFNHDYNSGNTIGISWAQFTIADGERQSASLSYLQPILSRPNLDIVVNTQVTKVLQTGTSGKLPVFRGVQFSQSASSKVYTLHATKEVILSAGSVKTPPLLMLSGIGDSAELSKLGIKTIVDSVDVGKNLQDHPFVLSQFTVNSTNTLDNLRNSTFVAQSLQLWQKNRTGELSLPSGNQWGWLRLPANASIFDTTPDPSAGPTSAHHEFIFVDEFLSFSSAPPVGGNFFTAFTVVVSPSSRGNITLASTNPFDAPVISPGMLGSEFDIFNMREALKELRRFVSAPAWKDWITGEFGDFAQAQTDDQLEQFARNGALTINHATCTAAMGKTGSTGPGSGVLNSDLTVKGTVGLRVVDASAFPFIPAAHTQVPTYALAERAADIIKACG